MAVYGYVWSVVNNESLAVQFKTSIHLLNSRKVCTQQISVSIHMYRYNIMTHY